MFKFEILAKKKNSRARAGRIHTSHGVIETPNFMPVGTQGAAKGLTHDQLKECGSQILLSNTYHLYIRPGIEVIRQAGGLHKFISWDKPILTDSGGFQVFSLSDIRKVSEEGVEFTSHKDGSKHMFTPENVVEMQQAFGSDMFMPLDVCVEYPCSEKDAKEAVERTTRWAQRSLKVRQLESSTLFGIVQGSTFPELRMQSAKEIRELGFPGYGIGGLSVNEPAKKMYEMLDVQMPLLPEDSPKHLLGVGFPENIREAVERGIDLFDCTIPTRVARHGTLLTSAGRVSIKNAQYEKDFSPIDASCDCYACRNYTKAYVRHLFMAKEILAITLMTIHNIRHFMKLMESIRHEIHG